MRSSLVLILTLSSLSIVASGIYFFSSFFISFIIFLFSFFPLNFKAMVCNLALTPTECDAADLTNVGGCWYDSANTGVAKCIGKQTVCALVSGTNCHLSPLATGYATFKLYFYLFIYLLLKTFFNLIYFYF